MKITINTDKIAAYHIYLVQELKRLNLYSEDGDIVWNIDSIHRSGIRKGKRLTIYWEIEDHRLRGSNGSFYKQADILYIGHKRYLNYYPQGTKVMYLASSPDFKEDATVKKMFEVVFVGSVEPLPCFYDRLSILSQFQNKLTDIAILYGSPAQYMHNLSLGKVILNILPNVDGNHQINAKVFESMMVGCLVCNHDPIMDEIFTPNIHYIPLNQYDSITDFQVSRIKRASREYVLENHTWKNRINQLIFDINEHLNNGR